MKFEHLPKASLLSGPTPLEKAAKLSKLLGGPTIYLKRDDMTGIGLGGNKVRKLEYLLGDALARNCNTAVTTAALQSNFLRIFTAACNRCGIRPVVFMRGVPEVPTGNYLCTMLLGAELHYVQTEDPYSGDTIQAMQDYALKEEQEGNNVCLIHLGTFSGPLATVGYIAGAEELFGQARELGIDPAAIYAPAGSGGTHAGLLAGARLLGRGTQIFGISVNVDAVTLANNIHVMMKQAISLVGAETEIPLSDIAISGDFIHPGYGQANAEGAEAIRIMAETEGHLLDPIYAGKALAALIRDVRNGRYSQKENIVFLYTGGTPNLFTHGKELLELMNDKVKA